MYKKIQKAFSVTKPSLNLVIRDHDQSVYANNMNSTMDPRYFQIAHLWNQGNKLGHNQFFGYFEAGGQEPGKTAMGGRNPGQLFAKLHQHAPDTYFRSLSRGGYGNSLFPLHKNDLFKWYNFINDSGKKVVFKVFDYNTNFKEMELALQVIHQLGAPIEIAIPHSPDPQYFDFFEQKVKQAAVFAQQYGASISVKRMVGGLTEDEAKRCADIIGSIAKQYGIKDVSLHAHGDVPNAIAQFIYGISQYGIDIARGDIVHKLSGGQNNEKGTFPNFYDVAERLSQLNMKIDVTQSQLDIIKAIEKIQLERDVRFSVVRVKGAFSVQDKVEMGMPDGGEAYTVEAIVKSGIPGKLKISLDKCQELFKQYYLEFRQRFGMIVSVTPGHKRIEEGSLCSMENTLNFVKDLAKELRVPVSQLDPQILRQELQKLPYDTLYENLNPKTVDALRNNHLPLKLSQDCMRFLCRTHMKNVLASKEYSNLEISFKDLLIQYAENSELVAHLVDRLQLFGKLPKEAGISNSENFHQMSLVQAAGIREYTEGAGASETGPNHLKKIKECEQNGSPISKVFGMQAAECISILTGTFSYVDVASRHGPTPSPEYLSKEEFQKDSDFFRKNIMQEHGFIQQQKNKIISSLPQKNDNNISDKKYSEFDDTNLQKDIYQHDLQRQIAKLVAQNL